MLILIEILGWVFGTNPKSHYIHEKKALTLFKATILLTNMDVMLD